MPTLGIALITKNAAAHLADCLAAVAWADQIVVVDSGSSDNTLAIAARFNAHIIQTPDWPGFGPQKNRALAALQTDWILALDADEIVSAELAESIQQAMQQQEVAVWQLLRRSSFCGQWVHHSGWNKDWVARLFRRDTAHYSDDLVHEKLVFNGQAGRLSGELLHYSYDDYETVLQKINAYSSAGAQQRFQRGQRASLPVAILRGLWAFLRTYIMKRGFLDGRAGFLIALMNAETTFYRFIKLQYLDQVSTSKQDR
ncbi:glycosyltransferase family 2 protein [Chitinibacter tainanensis]|uniref:glycosyltransferase family 2 protein n=1 Tax=Chitinibacter tainanensis TaxID=230667 RepID=UPI002353648C|nr:glycosyltransferase family 2 protein [Chitinibacter tainanensis]